MYSNSPYQTGGISDQGLQLNPYARAPDSNSLSGGYYGLDMKPGLRGGRAPLKGSYAYKQQSIQMEQMMIQQEQLQVPRSQKRLNRNNSKLAAIDHSGGQSIDAVQQNQQASIQFQNSLDNQKQMRKQQQTLVKELKNIEVKTQQTRENKILKLLDKIMSKKKVKKIPPPLEPLPYHMIPRRLIQELGINPPITATYHHKDGLENNKVDKKRQDFLARNQQPIQAFDRRLNQYGQLTETMEKSNLNEIQNQKANFLGLVRNEDQVTKILISKAEQLRAKQARQVVFGNDGPILDENPNFDELSNIESHSFASSYQNNKKPIIDQLREDLAVNRQKQQQLQDELKIPDFQKDEKVEIDEDEVSDQSVDADQERNKEKEENYNKIKDRLKKQKFQNKVTDAHQLGGKLLGVTFKLITALVGVMEEVRETRSHYRDQGIADFNNALPLYNEVLRGWLIRCCKTPILTIIKQPDLSMDFVPIDGGFMRDRFRKERFLYLKIRVSTIFQNLIQNSTETLFPKPLMTFMNSFMVEGGFLPYDFMTEFEHDIFEHDSSDALMNFETREKFLFIGSFIITQLLIDRILLRPVENGFNTQISETSLLNLQLLASIIHGIFSDVVYDTFKKRLIETKILQEDESDKKEILHEFIYARYKYHFPPGDGLQKLPSMEQIKFAYSDQGGTSIDNNSQWWKEMKVQCSKFIVLIYKLMDDSNQQYK